jgi:pimeloyl-ACP methyl ester carboxylesterase
MPRVGHAAGAAARLGARPADLVVPDRAAGAPLPRHRARPPGLRRLDRTAEPERGSRRPGGPQEEARPRADDPGRHVAGRPRRAAIRAGASRQRRRPRPAGRAPRRLPAGPAPRGRHPAFQLLAPQPAPLASIADRLEDVFAPALVVTGEHDTRWRQLVGDALAYGLPHGCRAVVAGAEHLCNLTHPDEYNRLVAAFAARVENALAERA